METLGQFLRKEREGRGVSLERLSGLTRINPNILKRIESDDFRAAPQPVYLKGFLKSYADHLGLDPRELLSRFEGQPVPRPKQEDEKAQVSRFPRLPKILWVSVSAAAAALAALAFFLSKG